MKREYFTFGGANSLAFDVWLQNPHSENMPEKDVELLTIPGRLGEMIIDHNRWKNVRLPYDLAIDKNFIKNFRGLKSAMLSKQGYQRLENSFEPDVFRLATVYQMIEPNSSYLHKAGQFTVVFDCKPQRFLKSGTEPITFAKHGSLSNFTGYPAQPLIRVEYSGEGELHIGAYTVKLYDTAAGELTIDCETMDAYREDEPMNHLIGCEKFPVLEAGSNAISWTGGITAVEITPRWWVL